MRPYVDILRLAIQEVFASKHRHKVIHAKLMLRFVAAVTKSGLHLKHIDAALLGFVVDDDSPRSRSVEKRAKELLGSKPALQQDCSIRMMPRLSYAQKEQQTRHLYQAASQFDQGSQQGRHVCVWDAVCAFFATIKKAQSPKFREAFVAYQGIVWTDIEELHGLLKLVDPVKIALEFRAEEGKAKDTEAALHDAGERASTIVPKLLMLDKYLGSLELGERQSLRRVGIALLDAHRPCQKMLEQQLPDAQVRARLQQLLLQFWRQFETMSPAAIIVAAQAFAHCCEDTLLIGIAHNAAQPVLTDAAQHHYWLSVAACASSASPDRIAPPCDTCCVHVRSHILSLYV